MLQVRAIEEMQADVNVKPDVACINAMVDAYQRLGDMAAAEALLPEAAMLASYQGPLACIPALSSQLTAAEGTMLKDPGIDFLARPLLMRFAAHPACRAEAVCPIAASMLHRGSDCQPRRKCRKTSRHAPRQWHDSSADLHRNVCWQRLCHACWIRHAVTLP